MAIDGVDIIDSDEGYDIYNYIVETYKDGEAVDKIIATILEDEATYCIDDFYTELYWTALAYSLWKIGHLPEEIKQKALAIIQKGASEAWLKMDEAALGQRQKVLNKLAKQLNRENPRPLKVPKPKTKRTPYFNVGDVFAIKFETAYGVLFVSAVDESPRKIEYHLACTRLLKKTKPTMDDFLQSQIACGKLNTAYCLKTDCWFNHKDLGKILSSFEKIGHVDLEDYLLGILAPASTLEDIYEEITVNPQIGCFQVKDTISLVKAFEEQRE